MREWTKSACVLAWSTLILVAAVAFVASARPAQASTRIASSRSQVTLPPAAHVAARPATAPHPAATGQYVVQPGDTLSVIASALAVRGGWQALYAANKRAIGPNPNVIRPGTVLTAPGRQAPSRYTIQAGDTLAGIAAALGVRGGWQALYAANRHAIGPNPDTIQAGAVLVTPRSAAGAPRQPVTSRPPALPHPAPPVPSASASPPSPASLPSPASPPPSPAPAHGSQPGTGKQGTGTQRTATPGSTGMPSWLAAMLLSAALLIGAAFLTEPAVAIFRRRQAAVEARKRVSAEAGEELDSGRLAAERARVILADHERLIVTYSQVDDTVYVLTPPGEDPRAVLRAARLILPENAYQELADHLGVQSNWPLE